MFEERFNFKEDNTMGHSISYYTQKVSTKTNLKKWINEITGSAYDPLETNSYHGNLTIHDNYTCNGYDEALATIRRLDDGWYSDHIVKYKRPSEKAKKDSDSWIEKRDSYINSHSIHKRTSKYIGCPECGSKLYLGYIRGEKCPLCHTDLRPESTIEKIKWYDKKAEDALKNGKQEEYWLAKIEYHC